MSVKAAAVCREVCWCGPMVELTPEADRWDEEEEEAWAAGAE